MSDEGQGMWEQWLKELDEKETYDWNPAAVMYARGRISELEAELVDAAEVADLDNIQIGQLEAENKALKAVARAADAVSRCSSTYSRADLKDKLAALLGVQK